MGWLGSHADELAGVTVAFLDPPYNDPILERALAGLDGLLVDDAVVVVEHAARHRLPRLARLEVSRERRYGDTAVTFLRR
jgi:16S rRNA G966 N2-methylase RsmD